MKKLLFVLVCVTCSTVFMACQKNQDLASTSSSEFGSKALGSTTMETEMQSVVSECGQFRTQTQGGWGARPAGNNPGTYLHAHFASAFPIGLTIGCDRSGFSVYYSSADAVTEFLPAGGGPSVLSGNANDPKAKSIKNVLLGHVTALALSVGFDFADPDFGPAQESLGNMVIASGAFAGKNINEFLFLANTALGGCATGYSFSELNQTATLINENFDDGTMDRGFLTCPTSRFDR